ncbi:hypothetical protein A0H81_10362 [Grifola frondosa]|uniref:Uncharacterized protein n=1 Tax=Grifola frondosa TaxID=5627 RepID=A0A1C7M0J0_GRIFR|nr:hypothetical protein A0H81_10362 [Grifola frondosa]
MTKARAMRTHAPTTTLAVCTAESVLAGSHVSLGCHECSDNNSVVSGRKGETTSTRGTTGDDEEKGFSDEQVYLARFVPQAKRAKTVRGMYLSTSSTRMGGRR